MAAPLFPKDPPASYCNVSLGHPLHQPYHDNEYGFPSTDETVIFERLCLEIMQAGLSWEIVLRKRPSLRQAFDGFDVSHVATYGEEDKARLLADSRIIRNKRKIDAIIENARRFLAMRDEQGGIAAWLDLHKGLSRPAWEKLMKQAFVFMGPEIAGEFLMSLGLIEGAHKRECHVWAKIRGIKAN